MINCLYCNKTVSSIGNLTRHQKTKTCLKARKGIEPSLIEDRFKCEYCNKYLCDDRYLKKHKVLCIERYKILLEEKDKLLEEKDKLLEEKDKLLEEKDREHHKLLEEKDREHHKLLEDKDREHRQLLEDKDKEITELKLKIRTTRIETEIEILRKDSQHNKEVIEEIAKQPKTTNTTNLVLPMIDTSHERIELMVREKLYRKSFVGRSSWSCSIHKR